MERDKERRERRRRKEERRKGEEEGERERGRERRASITTDFLSYCSSFLLSSFLSGSLFLLPILSIFLSSLSNLFLLRRHLFQHNPLPDHLLWSAYFPKLHHRKIQRQLLLQLLSQGESMREEQLELVNTYKFYTLYHILILQLLYLPAQLLLSDFIPRKSYMSSLT